MTADKPRDEGKQLLAAAARGEDPAGERHRALRAPTVAQLAALYPALPGLGLAFAAVLRVPALADR